MPILSIRHLTRYRYKTPVAFGAHRMMFRPLESYDQRLLTTKLVIVPEPVHLHYVHDVFGNCVGIARFADKARELSFHSRVSLQHTPVPAFEGMDRSDDPGAFPFSYSAEDMPDLLRSMERQHPDPDGVVDRWARSFVPSRGRARLQTVLAAMTQAIHSDFRYATRLAGAPQLPAETLALKSGACRDFAILMIEAVRSLGLAAQFVSGYIYSAPRQLGSLTKVGGGHTHAWARVYVPSCGWVEFDPTNGIVGNADLVRVAIARDPRQAIPLCGTWDGEADDFLDMEVEVEVTSDNDAGLASVRGPVQQPRDLGGVALAR